MFSHLVLSGGGLHGLCILGVLSTVRIEKITTISGSSVGALIGTLLCVASVDEIMSYANPSTLDLFDDDSIDLANIIEHFGLIDPSKLISFISSIFEKKLIIKEPTFQQLYESCNIKLTISGTNVSKHTPEYFNYINTPEMSVLKAIEISISIPLIFKQVIHNGDVYADGCLMKMLPTDSLDKDVDKNTVLCVLITAACAVENNTLMQYVQGIMNCAMMSQSCMSKRSNEFLTVYVDPHKEYNVLQSVTIDDVNVLYDYGVELGNEFNKKLA